MNKIIFIIITIIIEFITKIMNQIIIFEKNYINNEILENIIKL
jgi:hypothetical protein